MNVPVAGALHVITSDARRGAEVFALNLAESLAADFPGRVVALQSGGGGSSLGVETLGTSWLSRQVLRRLRSAMKGSTVVVAHGSVTLPAVVIAGMGLRVPIVYKNIGDPWFWATSARRRWQTIMLLRRVDYVAALTSTAARAVEECWRVNPARIVVTGGGRDSRRFRPATSVERHQARVGLGLADEEAVVLVLGALSVEKRPGLALEVAKRLPQLTFLFAGDGPLRAEVAERARAIGPRIRVLGMRDDSVRLLHAADALILTSESEGLPGVLIEAGLCGIPSVAPDVGYVSDVIENGVTGLITPSGAVEELVEALTRVLATREPMGRAARDRCVSLFDVDVVQNRWLGLLERATSGSTTT